MVTSLTCLIEDKRWLLMLYCNYPSRFSSSKLYRTRASFYRLSLYTYTAISKHLEATYNWWSLHRFDCNGFEFSVGHCVVHNRSVRANVGHTHSGRRANADNRTTSWLPRHRRRIVDFCQNMCHCHIRYGGRTGRHNFGAVKSCGQRKVSKRSPQDPFRDLAMSRHRKDSVRLSYGPPTITHRVKRTIDGVAAIGVPERRLDGVRLC